MVPATCDAAINIASHVYTETIYLKDFGGIAHVIIPHVAHESGVWTVIYLVTFGLI